MTALLAVFLCFFGLHEAGATQGLSLFAQAGGGTEIIVPGRSYVLEAVIVVALAGLVLFVICRPTNR